jgi:hypothetical protein
MTKSQFKEAKKTMRDVDMTKRYFEDRSESYDGIAWVVIVVCAIVFILWEVI